MPPKTKKQKKPRPLKFHEPKEKDPAKRVAHFRRIKGLELNVDFDFLRDVRGKNY